MSYWKADPFEAEWSILAKSYSVLHGDGTCCLSPHRFLQLCAPLIGVSARDMNIYLSVMDWEAG